MSSTASGYELKQNLAGRNYHSDKEGRKQVDFFWS